MKDKIGNNINVGDFVSFIEHDYSSWAYLETAEVKGFSNKSSWGNEEPCVLIYETDENDALSIGARHVVVSKKP
jgi:hypothetical protein